MIMEITSIYMTNRHILGKVDEQEKINSALGNTAYA